MNLNPSIYLQYFTFLVVDNMVLITQNKPATSKPKQVRMVLPVIIPDSSPSPPPLPGCNSHPDSCTDCKCQTVYIQCEELPFGWEKVEDTHYGTYYIDHVNKRTQYENPVAQAKKSQVSGVDDVIGSCSTFPRQKKIQEPAKRSASESDMNGHVLGSDNKMKFFFTKNPAELKGEIIKTTLVKSVRGFGFTIVGGDHSDQEFLQIKNVVPNGPAYIDGQLKTGDILVYVNEKCVLGYTHQDVILLFQAILPGDEVILTVCRGYTLPFDPDDPNTEIVTRVAVSLPSESGTTNVGPSNSLGYGNGSNLDQLNTSQKSLKSLPDLARSTTDNNSNLSSSQRSQSGDLLNSDNTPDVLIPNSNKPEILVVNIVRGAMGFGFTIADSSYGQRVKQILDKTRCKNLMEGDVLLEINNNNVKDMSHAEVVQVLKDCPKGDETTIVVQRGGISSPGKSRRQAKLVKSSSEGSRPKNQTENSGIPGAYFFSSSSQEQVSDREDEDDESDVRAKSPLGDPTLRKTATSGDQRSKFIAEHRPKTPTRTAGLKIDSRHRTATIGRPPFSSNFTKQFRKDYLPSSDDHWSYNEQRSFERDYFPSYEYSTRPPPGPRTDHFRHDYTVSRADNRFRTDLAAQRQNTMHNFQQEYERSQRYDYSNREGIRPGQFRSRTPGPELMNRSLSGESRHEPSRPKTPTAQEMRSKTPMPTSTHNHAGISDFGLSSRYQTSNISWGMNGHRQAFAHKAWAYSSLDHGHTLRRETSLDNPAYSSFDRSYPNNNYSPNLPGVQGSPGIGAGRPSRQSTSFENEEPAPSNLTRIPKRYPPPSSNSFHHLPGSQSPRSPNRFPDYDEGLRHMEMSVILRRQESGFGFRIIGGTEEGSQVSVGHIVPGGSADIDGRLRTGDEIMYVDSHCVLNASHHKVVQLMGNAAINGRVSLRIRRRLLTTSASVTGQSMPEQVFYRAGGVSESYPYDVTVTRREHEGFGFVIISSVTKAGSTIGRILENSPAERCNRLHVGDRILAVNNVDISHMHHEEIVNLIKDSGYSVTLTIGPPQGTNINNNVASEGKQNNSADPKASGGITRRQNGEVQTSQDDASSTTSTSQRSSAGSMINAMAYPAISESDLSHRSEHSPYHQPANERYSTTTQHAERPKDMSRPPRIQNHQSSQDNEDEIYSVKLHRGTRGFGFSIRGGREFNNMPLYVLRIAEGGTADLDSRLRVGDQILEINGYSMNNITHQEAIDIIQNGGNSVQLLVKRTGKPPPSFDGLPSPTNRTGGALGMTNGPIGHSSPHMGRRNTTEHPSDYFPDYNYSRSYPNY